MSITVGNCIGDGWNVVKNDFGQFILATFLYFAIMMGLQTISMGLQRLAFFGQIARVFIEPPLVAGYCYFCLLKLRGQFAEISVLFAAFKNRRYWSAMGAYWLTALFAALAMLPVVAIAVPIIISAHGAMLAPASILVLMLAGLAGLAVCMYVSIGLITAVFFVMDRGYTAWTAVKASWEITKGSRWSILWITMVAGLINLVGLMMCGVGLLFTMPVGAGGDRFGLPPAEYAADDE